VVSNGPTPRLLFVSEFAGDDDWHYPSVAAALAALPELIECSPVRGFSTNRTGGGLHFRRLLNGAWVYLRLPFALAASMARRESVAIVCITTPPGIHLWCALLGRLTGTPVVCWLMDYHPEIEARWLEQREWGRPGARLLRWLDRRALRCCRGIIALDDAMASLCRSRAPAVRVESFPTWPSRELSGLEPAQPGRRDAKELELRLLHAGSLGRAHDLDALSRLLDAIPVRCRLTLLGADERTRRAFSALATSHDVDLVVRPRLAPEAFAKALATSGADFGIVLLKDRYAGLVSPSKFTAYAAAAIPVLTIGPPGTTAHRLAAEFGAGVHLPNDPGNDELVRAAEQLMDPAARTTFRSRAVEARDWLRRYDAEAFAALLADMVHPDGA
jgi:hypothetical protein